MSKLIFTTGILVQLLLYADQVPSQSIQDFLVNEQGSPDGAEQSLPCIAGDGNGNYVVTWQDDRSGNNFDIYAQIYINGGTIQGTNFKVNDDEGTSAQYRPYAAADPEMNLVIVWIDRRESNEWDIYAQRYSSDGQSIGPNFKVNDDTGVFEQEHPSVAMDSLGNFVVVWADERNGNFDIYAQQFTSNGSVIGNNFKLNDDAGDAVQYWPNCARAKDGSFIATWVDKRINDDYNIFAQRFSPGGSALGNNFQVNTDAGDAFQLRPVVSIDAVGGFKIAWEDNRNSEWDIFIQLFQNDGSPIGNNFIVQGNPQGTGQRNARTSGDPLGDFVICWEDDRNDYADVYARRYAFNGNPIGDCFKVNDDTTGQYQYNARVCMDDNGDFRIVWQDHRMGWNGDVFAQSYLNDGTAVADNLKVNDDAGSENQQWPSLAVDGNGNMIFAWVDDRDFNSTIYAQRFSASGTALGDNFKVVDDSLGNLYTIEPSVAASQNSEFIITWADLRNGYCFEIYAQRFSADGIPQGNNFQVSNSGACMKYSPVVAYKENGNFIIVWNDADEGGYHKPIVSPNLPEDLSNKNKGTEPDVYAQLYLNDGTPFGGNFMVNEEPGFTYQEYPSVAVDANGNFIIAWQDDRNDFINIYLQRFLNDGTPSGNNFPAEDYLFLYDQFSPSVSMDGAGNYTVAWQDLRNGNFDIFCRQFNNNGTPLESSFQVNTDTSATYQFSSCVSVQNDGKFVVTWTDCINGSKDVFAQRYWSDGLPYGNNFIVPGSVAFEQSYQNVVLDNNLIYSTWQDNREGQYGYDIWANVLDWDVGVGTANDPISDNGNHFGLSQNFPNPFKTSTTISYTLEVAGTIQLEIYDLRGRLVNSEDYEFQQAGIYEIKVSGIDSHGGVYLYRVISGVNISETRKMIIME